MRSENLDLSISVLPVFLVLPLFLFFFFPSPLSPLPHPLTCRKRLGEVLFKFCLLHLAKPSQGGTAKEGTASLNESAEELWRKALIIPIKMLSQHSSK